MNEFELEKNIVPGALVGGVVMDCVGGVERKEHVHAIEPLLEGGANVSEEQALSERGEPKTRFNREAR